MMKVTRDVVRDLYPLYQAGEASADSVALVEAFLASDPELAGSLPTDEDLALPEAEAPLVREEEAMRLLRRTKSLINLRSWLMGLALFVTILPLSVHHDGQELHWVFLGDPRAVGLFLVLATACWLGYFAIDRRLRGTAL